MFNKDGAAKLLEAAGVFYPIDDGDPMEAHVLNMNDVWAWALAWGEKVEDEDLPEVAGLFWRYGNAGLLYWMSKKHEGMRSEFYDNNRAIEFVEHEEQIRLKFPGSSERAYHKASYRITGSRNVMSCWKFWE